MATEFGTHNPVKFIYIGGPHHKQVRRFGIEPPLYMKEVVPPKPRPAMPWSIDSPGILPDFIECVTYKRLRFNWRTWTAIYKIEDKTPPYPITNKAGKWFWNNEE